MDKAKKKSEGAAHPAMNPYRLPENAACRKEYSKDMCARSLAVLNRTVMVATDPRHTEDEIDDMIHDIGVAARVALADLPREHAEVRKPRSIDRAKFDMGDSA